MALLPPSSDPFGREEADMQNPGHSPRRHGMRSKNDLAKGAGVLFLVTIHEFLRSSTNWTLV